mmetsp:Transcript_50799/g.128097  ORF Transcript_50799/g.128097 Transcript_50799/m.128097 type:complete len:237 (+) Transcript_50799:2-712(+)
MPTHGARGPAHRHFHPAAHRSRRFVRAAARSCVDARRSGLPAAEAEALFGEVAWPRSAKLPVEADRPGCFSGDSAAPVPGLSTLTGSEGSRNLSNTWRRWAMASSRSRMPLSARHSAAQAVATSVRTCNNSSFNRATSSPSATFAFAAARAASGCLNSQSSICATFASALARLASSWAAPREDWAVNNSCCAVASSFRAPSASHRASAAARLAVSAASFCAASSLLVASNSANVAA